MDTLAGAEIEHLLVDLHVEHLLAGAILDGILVARVKDLVAAPVDLQVRDHGERQEVGVGLGENSWDLLPQKALDVVEEPAIVWDERAK